MSGTIESQTSWNSEGGQREPKRWIHGVEGEMTVGDLPLINVQFWVGGFARQKLIVLIAKHLQQDLRTLSFQDTSSAT